MVNEETKQAQALSEAVEGFQARSTTSLLPESGYHLRLETYTVPLPAPAAAIVLELAGREADESDPKDVWRDAFPEPQMTRRQLDGLLKNVILDAGAKQNPGLTTNSGASSINLVLVVATGKNQQLVEGRFQVKERVGENGSYWMVTCRQDEDTSYTRIGIVRSQFYLPSFKFEEMPPLKWGTVDLR